MIDWKKTIPDGLEMKSQRATVRVFNPAWWRVDRWAFWLWISFVARRPRGKVSFSAIDAGQIHTFELPVYEVGKAA